MSLSQTVGQVVSGYVQFTAFGADKAKFDLPPDWYTRKMWAEIQRDPTGNARAPGRDLDKDERDKVAEYLGERREAFDLVSQLGFSNKTNSPTFLLRSGNQMKLLGSYDGNKFNTTGVAFRHSEITTYDANAMLLAFEKAGLGLDDISYKFKGRKGQAAAVALRSAVRAVHEARNDQLYKNLADRSNAICEAHKDGLKEFPNPKPDLDIQEKLRIIGLIQNNLYSAKAPSLDLITRVNKEYAKVTSGPNELQGLKNVAQLLGISTSNTGPNAGPTVAPPAPVPAGQVTPPVVQGQPQPANPPIPQVQVPIAAPIITPNESNKVLGMNFTSNMKPI